LGITPNAQETEVKRVKWGYINLNSFCIAKETVHRLKRHLTEWGKIFANYSSNQELICRIKETQTLNKK
jgi:hypothetical protein